MSTPTIEPEKEPRLRRDEDAGETLETPEKLELPEGEKTPEEPEEFGPEIQAVVEQERQKEIEELLTSTDAFQYGKNIRAMKEASWGEKDIVGTVFRKFEELRSTRPYLEKLGEKVRPEVARELVEFELKTTLFDSFFKEATETGLSEEVGLEHLEKVKNGFRELILTGKLTNQDLETLIAGGIHYVKELKGKTSHEPVGGAVAIFLKNSRAMVVGEALFQQIPDDGNNDTKRIIYHEVAHSLENALLSDLPKEAQEEIEKVLDQPELYQYLEGSYLSRELGALAKKIEAFHKEEPGSENYKKLETEIGEKKKVLRGEFLTEKVATYLESDGTPESYLAMRARRAKAENIEKFKAAGGTDPFRGELETIYPLLHRAFEDKAGWRERMAEEKYEEWQYDEYYDEDELDFYVPLAEQDILNKQALREKGLEPKKEGPLTTLFRLFNQALGNKKELPPKMAKKGLLG